MIIVQLENINNSRIRLQIITHPIVNSIRLGSQSASLTDLLQRNSEDFVFDFFYCKSPIGEFFNHRDIS